MPTDLPTATTVFDLPARLPGKAAAAAIGPDEDHLRAVADALVAGRVEVAERLTAARRAPAGGGQRALDRDQEIHRLTARLQLLRRFGADLCLGRMTPTDGGAPVYVGRLGLTDAGGRRLLVDWRTPAAEPFFGATLADPMGLAGRRRYRWQGGRVVDYWDETFDPGRRADGVPGGTDDTGGTVAPDDQTAFLASLAGPRTDRMRDVLATIAADQDAVIRAGSAGALVVDGGPGTGKTVVALHRTAYLQYRDPRLASRRGGVLFVGPHQVYLDYVADVLPGLGEQGVATCTLRDLVPEGAAAGVESDPAVAALKAAAPVEEIVEAAVAFHEQPPTDTAEFETDWGTVRVRPEDWATAFAAPEPGTPHHTARSLVWAELLDVLVAQADDEEPEAAVRRSLARSAELRAAFGRAFPTLQAADVVADLWSVPAYLRRCAPWLSPDQVRTLQRPDPYAWTVSDLPLLDAARRRLGDPDAERRAARERAAQATQRRQMAEVVADLVAADDSELQLMSMLRGADADVDLVERSVLRADDPSASFGPDTLAGPFGHVVVDEAQELTDAEWSMIRGRVPSGSITVVGDRAQARAGFDETWEARLARVGFGRVRIASLTVNYRTPREIMTVAAPVIRAVLPSANVPVSVRDSGLPVRYGRVGELDTIVRAWLDTRPDGIGCVVDAGAVGDASWGPRVRRLPPVLTKGLEFDLVVLVAPGRWGDTVSAAVDRYVAMTRATSQLVVLDG